MTKQIYETMRKHISTVLFLLVWMLTGVDIKAQEAPAGFRAEFLEQFTYSTDRLLSLSEAIPAEKYAW